MPENFNDDIERLSKLAAENFLTDEQAPAWNSIEQLLDKEMPVKDNKRKFILFFFLMAALLAGRFFMYTQKTNSSSAKAITAKKFNDIAEEKNNTSSAKNENILSNKIKNQQINENRNSEQPLKKPASVSLIKKDNDALNTYVIKQKNATAKSDVGQENNAVNNDTQKAIENSTAEKNKLLLNNNNTEVSSVNLTEVLKNNEQKNIENNTATLTQLIQKNVYLDSSSDAKNQNKQTAISPESKQQQASTENKKSNKNKTNVPGRVFVTALYGNDISTVNFTNNDKAGTGFGILAGYDFSKRWSVRSGIIFSKKDYITNGNNFKLDVSKLSLPAYNTLQLEEVNALSRIVEIPLNIRYRFNPDKKSGFFVSTGLSAYFTKWEDIDYSIVLDGTKAIEVERTYGANEEETIHSIAGIFDLSAGWHTSLNKRFSFELEPFAKLPFTKMGVGDIKLMSFGVCATLSYRPFNKKIKTAK